LILNRKHNKNETEINKLTEINLDAVVAQLSELTDKPAEDVKAEIEELMEKHGYNVAGAISVWKSDNKFLIASDRKEYHVRVLCKELPRTATMDDKPTQVGNIHMAYNDPETGALTFNSTTAWGQERIDQLYAMFDVGEAYTLKARLNKNGNLAWIRTVEQGGDAPALIDIAGAPMASLADVIGQYEYVKGWVGRVIKPQNTVLGFEVDDLGGSPPLTIWFGGQYSKMSINDIDDVSNQLSQGANIGAYGYISGVQNDVRMSASAVFFF